MDSREIIDKLQGRSIFPWQARPGQEYVVWDYESNEYLIYTYTRAPFYSDYSDIRDGDEYQWLPMGYGLLP